MYLDVLIREERMLLCEKENKALANMVFFFSYILFLI